MSSCALPLQSSGKLIKPFSCGQPIEKDRYMPLSIAINAIMREFADTAFGPLPIPNAMEGEEQILYSPNDPNVIESKHLHAVGHHKPDIIGMPLSSYCDIYTEYEKANSEDMEELIAKNALRNTKASRKPIWKDPRQTWELKVEEPKLVYEEYTWTVDEILHPVEQPPAKANLKRTLADVDVKHGNPAPKKSCASRSAATHSARPSIRPENAPPPDPIPTLQPDDQCGIYAVDRLTASWTIMYTTVILLTGERYFATGLLA